MLPRIIGCLTMLIAVIAGLSAAEPGSTNSINLALLLEELNADSFGDREVATQQLLAADSKILPDLQRALPGASSEARYRLRRIIAHHEAVTINKRLAAFERDIEGKTGADLPGWKQFRQTIGDSSVDRTFFAEMYRAEPALMQAVATGSKETTAALYEAIGRQFQELQQPGTRKEISLGTISAYWFAGSDPAIKLDPNAMNLLYSLLHRGNHMATAVTEGPLRRIFIRWVERDQLDGNAMNLVQIAQQANLPQLNKIAAKVIKDTAQNGYGRLNCMKLLCSIDREQAIPLFEQLLNDESVAVQYFSKNRTEALKAGMQPEQLQLQMRDAAVIYLLALCGKNPADLDLRLPALEAKTEFQLQYQSVTIADDDARKKLHAKFSTWWKENREKHIPSALKP